MEDRVEVRALLDAYSFLVDRGRIADLADLFTPDGVMEGPVGEAGVGRAGIEQFFRSAADRVAEPPKLMRHHVTSCQVVVDGDDADAQSYFLALTDLGLDHWGGYRDRIVRHRGSWRIVRRTLRVDGWSPGSWWERNQGVGGP